MKIDRVSIELKVTEETSTFEFVDGNPQSMNIHIKG